MRKKLNEVILEAVKAFACSSAKEVKNNKQTHAGVDAESAIAEEMLTSPSKVASALMSLEGCSLSLAVCLCGVVCMVAYRCNDSNIDVDALMGSQGSVESSATERQVEADRKEMETATELKSIGVSKSQIYKQEEETVVSSSMAIPENTVGKPKPRPDFFMQFDPGESVNTVTVYSTPT
jgi:hypothetical protein